MYDRSGCGVNLRKYVSVSLALWHNFKWCSYRLCEVYQADFIAPCYHSILPDTEFNLKLMKMPSITTLMSYMRLAYPKFQQQLIMARREQNLTPRSRNLLTNLYHLFEFFIPIVSFFLSLFMLHVVVSYSFYVFFDHDKVIRFTTIYIYHMFIFTSDTRLLSGDQA